jgi:hypothetical protein
VGPNNNNVMAASPQGNSQGVKKFNTLKKAKLATPDYQVEAWPSFTQNAMFLMNKQLVIGYLF